MRILLLLSFWSCGLQAQVIAPFLVAPTAAAGGSTALVQTGQFVFAATDSGVKNITITSIDTNRTWVYFGWRGSAPVTENHRREDKQIDLTSPTNITLKRVGTGGGQIDTVRWYAVTDSGLTVKRYRGAWSTSSATYNFAITAVDTAKSWLYVSSDFTVAGAGGYLSWGPYFFSTAGDIDTVRLQEGGTVSGTKNVVLQVISYDSCRVRHFNGASAARKAFSIGRATDSTKAFATAYLIGNVSGGTHLGLWTQISPNGNDTLLAQKYSTSTSYTFYASVIEFTDGTMSYARGFSFASDNINPVAITFPAASDSTKCSAIGSGGITYGNGANNAGGTYTIISMTSVVTNGSTVTVKRNENNAAVGTGNVYRIEWKGVQ